jgi:flagellar motility protein MotE (MotC chaperone)
VTGLPRFLPLVAVAAVGVLAINLVENGPGIIGAARGFAEGAAAKTDGAKADKALPADASIGAPAVVAAKPAPVCAPTATDLAKEAGLSPAELQVLQSLGDRRGALDEREQGLDTQVELIAAAEAKVDAKIATMNQLKADMQTLLGQLDDKQQAEVDRLVKVYEAMKPADSAARFVLLTDEVRLPIAAKMKEKALSAMIAKMPPPEAKRLTESLAARYVAQADAARAALNPPPAAAAAAATTPPATPAKPPAQVAAANPPPATPTTPAATAPPKPVHHKPHTIHHPAADAAGATASAAAKPPTPGAAKPLASAGGGAAAPPSATAPKTPAPAAPSSPPPAKTG